VFNYLDKVDMFEVDVIIVVVCVDDFDLFVLFGGVVNFDVLWMDFFVVVFVKVFMECVDD